MNEYSLCTHICKLGHGQLWMCFWVVKNLILTHSMHVMCGWTILFPVHLIVSTLKNRHLQFWIYSLNYFLWGLVVRKFTSYSYKWACKWINHFKYEATLDVTFLANLHFVRLFQTVTLTEIIVKEHITCFCLHVARLLRWCERS